jgi:hypothetical protein
MADSLTLEIVKVRIKWCQKRVHRITRCGHIPPPFYDVYTDLQLIAGAEFYNDAVNLKMRPCFTIVTEQDGVF